MRIISLSPASSLGGKASPKRFAVAALALILVVAAVAKAVSAPSGQHSLAPAAYWAALCIECLCLFGLMSSRTRVAAVALALLFAVSGVVHALWFRLASCCCLGEMIPLTWRGELLLAGAMGLCCVVVLFPSKGSSGVLANSL